MTHRLPNRKLSEYGIKKNRLGGGSFGEVNSYEVTSEIDGQTKFAVKTFKNFKQLSYSILKEVSAMISLPPSPFIVPLIDVTTTINEDKTIDVHMIMPSGVGLQMSTLLRADDQMEFKKQLYQLAISLAQIHQYDIWHCDIKPQNYIYFPKTDDLALTDFGICRTGTCSDPSREFNDKIYSLWYRSIELLLGYKGRDLAADVWALGCVFYEFLTKRPFNESDNDEDAIAVIYRRLGGPAEDSPLRQLPGYRKESHNDVNKIFETKCRIINTIRPNWVI